VLIATGNKSGKWRQRVQLRFKVSAIASALVLFVGLPLALAGPAAAADTAASSTAPATGDVTSNAITNNNILNYGTCQASGSCNLKDDKCLGIIGGKDDAEAVLWSCETAANQQWHWGKSYPGSGDPGARQLINGDGQCLGVLGGKVASGAEVVGWTCLGSGHPDQYWFDQLSQCSAIECNYFENESNSNLILSTENFDLGNGTEITVYGYDPLLGPNPEQMWL
jgi:hypothetical protein